MAAMIANGQISPTDAIMRMRDYEDEASTVMSSAYASGEDDDDSSYYSESDSDFDSDEEEELVKFVGEIGGVRLGAIEEH